VLHENTGMLKLARALGFGTVSSNESGFVHVRLALQESAGASGAGGTPAAESDANAARR